MDLELVRLFSTDQDYIHQLCILHETRLSCTARLIFQMDLLSRAVFMKLDLSFLMSPLRMTITYLTPLLA